MVKSVIKRSKEEVEYSRDKIENAILKASREVVDDNEAEVIASETSFAVEEILSDKYKKPDVEDIQDVIEQTLMRLNHFDVAKAFILYREKHNEMRNTEWLNSDLSESIWKNKYRYDNETLDEFFVRVSNGNKDIEKMIKLKYFSPAGRILANRGLQHYGKKVTFSNCYVAERPKDNIESIFKSASDLARTFSYGGGSGIDISNLRPKGSKVNNSAKTTDGATSFMHLYDVTSKIIGQKGRRAALMISLICSHPDVIDFVNIKNNLEYVTKANISLRITDEFMNCVNEGKKFHLKFHVKDTDEIIEREIDSREMFNKIALSNWRMAEPGFLFWDEFNRWNLLSEDDEFEYAGVNPCAEECLPENGSCNLSSLNLSNFVVNEFESDAHFDFDKFKSYVKKATIFLNEILDEGLPLHPLKGQRETVRNWRQIGLGVMGLADMFIKLGIKYGSDKSIEMMHEIGDAMINATLQQSALLAKEHGTYPKYRQEAITKSDFFIKNANVDTLKLVLKYGLRNSQLTTVAPTGSISNVFGISGGLEPIFAFSYKRITKTLHDKDKEYNLFTPIVREYMSKYNIDNVDELPDYFVSSHDIPYEKRIDVQSAFQEHIDASISSTINLPNEATVTDVKNLYMYAWKKRVKGVTIYRDGCSREGILSTEKTEKKGEMEEQDFIDQNICPTCKFDLVQRQGCKECQNCGYTPCSL